MKYINLECILIKKKLRVRVITNGYNNKANCRFPRKLRLDGRQYKIKSDNIKTCETKNNKFYYIVKGDIEIIKDYKPEKIYDSSLCAVCLNAEAQMCYIPCNHMCICLDCDKQYNCDKCIMCRSEILRKINKDNFI